MLKKWQSFVSQNTLNYVAKKFECQCRCLWNRSVV